MSFLPNISPGNVPSILPVDWKYDTNDIWSRPVEWIDLNAPNGVPEKIIGIVAVFPNERSAQNYVAFNLDTLDSSTFTVDWGDGTVETLASNVSHYHIYDYDTLSADTEFRGYRQARFEVSLNSGVVFGGNSGQINFNIDGPYVTATGNQYRTGANIIDLFVSSSNATTITINSVRPMVLLEQLEVRNTSSNRLLTPRTLYQGCSRLRSIPFVPYINNLSAENYLQTFGYCHALVRLPDDFADPDKFWFKNPSGMQQVFEYCYSLKYLPRGLFGEVGTQLSNCNSFYLMFRDCRNIRYIPYIGVRETSGVNITYMFSNCLDLRALPQGFNITRATSLLNTFAGCRECYDFSVISENGLDQMITTSNFSAQGAFNNLDSLKEFPYIGQFGRVSTLYQAFYGSTQIERFNSQYSYLDFTSSTSLRDTFAAMESLQELPPIHVSNLNASSSLYQTFNGCKSLNSVKFVGMITGPSDGEYYRCFYACSSLQYIEGIDFSYANDSLDYNQIFYLARNINYIKFPGGPTDETGFKYAVSLQYCPLSRDAMLEIFNHLCTISHSAVLDIRNNSYTSELTNNDKLIATNKGWTLSL